MTRAIENCKLHWRYARPAWPTFRLVPTAIGLAVLCIVSAGCDKGPSTKVVYGSVTCGGEIVPTGRITFVPIAAGRLCAAPIVDGQYRIDAQGGAPFGRYRVEIDARKKTGRQIEGHNGSETTMIDEKVRMGPQRYAGDQSPLVVDIRADSDGQFDVAIPRQ